MRHVSGSCKMSTSPYPFTRILCLYRGLNGVQSHITVRIVSEIHDTQGFVLETALAMETVRSTYIPRLGMGRGAFHHLGPVHRSKGGHVYSMAAFNSNKNIGQSGDKAETDLSSTNEFEQEKINIHSNHGLIYEWYKLDSWHLVKNENKYGSYLV